MPNRATAADPIADPAVPAVEEPYAVPDDGAAERSVHFVRPVDAVHRRNALAHESRGQVGRREVAVHRLVVEGSGELVSAFARDHRDAYPAGGSLRVGTARLDGHLVRERVVQVVLRRAVAAEVVELHAVDENGGVVVCQPRGPDGVLSVMARRLPSMSTGLAASTTTPGSTPPVLSVTWPTIRLWPCATAGSSAMPSRTTRTRRSFPASGVKPDVPHRQAASGFIGRPVLGGQGPSNPATTGRRDRRRRRCRRPSRRTRRTVECTAGPGR